MISSNVKSPFRRKKALITIISLFAYQDISGEHYAEVESVFRTTEGFTTPWAKWRSGHSNDARVNTVEDCVRRDPSNGLWTDINCGGNLKFYCEGEKTFQNFTPIQTAYPFFV